MIITVANRSLLKLNWIRAFCSLSDTAFGVCSRHFPRKLYFFIQISRFGNILLNISRGIYETNSLFGPPQPNLQRLVIRNSCIREFFGNVKHWSTIDFPTTKHKAIGV